MKKSVLALILVAVFIIIVSPALVGKLAEESVSENLSWAADESGELVVTSQGFDRGWFSSEGQHRIKLGDGSIRSAMIAAGEDGGSVPVLLINTHIDHGLIPVSSLSREEGSLMPGLGSAVSTLAIEYSDGKTIDVPGAIYSNVSLGGNLDSQYILGAGAQDVDDGEVTWQSSTINIESNAKTGNINFSGDIGTMTFGNSQQVVSFDSMTIVGQQASTPSGFYVGDVDMTLGPMTITARGIQVGGMQGLTVKGFSSIDDGAAEGAVRLEMKRNMILGYGDISVIADMNYHGLDADALGAVSKRLDDVAGATDPGVIMMAADDEFKDLFAAGINFAVDQLDVALPMGTVQTAMTIKVSPSDRVTFEWTSLLLNTVATIDIIVPEALVQFATSMNPQAGALIGMGYLKKEGDVYIMDADLNKGLLTINGAPVPIPLGAFQ